MDARRLGGVRKRVRVLHYNGIPCTFFGPLNFGAQVGMQQFAADFTAANLIMPDFSSLVQTPKNINCVGIGSAGMGTLDKERPALHRAHANQTADIHQHWSPFSASPSCLSASPPPSDLGHLAAGPLSIATKTHKKKRSK